MSAPAPADALPGPGPDGRVVRATCPYCGVGCGVLVEARGDAIVDVRGDPDHPANRGALCTKGSTLALVTSSRGRLLAPEMRASRDEPRARCTWDAALDRVADRFVDIARRHGPDAVALFVSGQLLTEDYYVFNKLAKGLLGTNNIDSNSRLCMSSAVAGYKATLGVDAPPCCYEDIDFADTLFITGSNTAYAHPVAFRRIEAAKERRPDMRIVVVDPRRTDTAALADLHLAIQPGTDVALHHGMLHVMLWEGLVDEAFVAAHTRDFAALKSIVADFGPREAAAICGVAPADLVQAARWFAGRGNTLSLWCQGLNQSSHGTANNATLVNLHLATGQIGRPGAGPFSLTGQPNAMGGREVGGMANLLSAHRDLSNPVHRAEVARLWGVESVPERPGLTAVALFEALRAGSAKAVWIVCTNPAQSMPNQTIVREALRQAEFVVVQEIHADTETAMFADVLLPAATFSEKDGTVTNSERRISRVQPARAAPGEARPDWRIARDVAIRMERELRPGRPTLFPYARAEDAFDEHRATTAGRDVDITGLSYAVLERDGPQQWPYPAGARAGTPRLYTDFRFATDDGRARFHPAPYRPVAEAADARYPFRLNTGRLRDQWHGMSRTGRVARLYGHAPEPTVSLSERDYDRLGLSADDLVRVRSRRGSVVVRAERAADVQSGHAFLPMHWGSAHLSGQGVNAVTIDTVDEISRQPELKHCAVAIDRPALPWRLVAMAALPDADAAAELLGRLRGHLGACEYASCGLFGTARDCVILRVARKRDDPDLVAAVDVALGLAQAELTYEDGKRHVGRRLRIADDTVVAARLSGDLRAQEWLCEWIASARPASGIGLLLLAPITTAPAGYASRGRIVCNCMDVSEREIALALGEEGASGLGATARVERLKEKLKCGTQCGSCLPELRRIAAAPPGIEETA